MYNGLNDDNNKIEYTIESDAPLNETQLLDLTKGLLLPQEIGFAFEKYQGSMNVQYFSSEYEQLSLYVKRDYVDFVDVAVRLYEAVAKLTDCNCMKKANQIFINDDFAVFLPTLEASCVSAKELYLAAVDELEQLLPDSARLFQEIKEETSAADSELGGLYEGILRAAERANRPEPETETDIEAESQTAEKPFVMRCTGCGAEYVENFSFCTRCGTKLEKIILGDFGKSESAEELEQKVAPETSDVIADASGVSMFGETTLLGFASCGETSVLNGIASSFDTPNLIRESTGEKIYINKRNFLIGKSSDKTDCAVKNNGAISRVHAEISVVGSEYYVTDKDSTNHTYVNNSMLTPNIAHRIFDGDEIKLANEVFRFHLQ